MNQGLIGNKIHYRDIFNYFAKQGKITKDKLEEMFRLVQLYPSPEEMEKYMNIVFENRSQASLDDFLRLFKMRCVSQEYTSEEIKKGFILLSDSERKLSIARVEELIKSHVSDPREQEFLIDHMRHFTDESGNVNYNDFISSSF
jgi:Ca2+-binding EF-hand superfamily protein